MLKRILTLLFSVLLLSLTVFAGVIKEGSLSASSDGAYITIRWMSEDESGVAKFVLERKAGINGSFMPLTELLPRGNNSLYQYVDDTAFRVSESIYKYQVKVVFSNGQAPVYYGPITVSHKTSDVRRTWGSIKAMFR
ncbi:MAG: hypothetical protein AAB344_03455 [Bacteroidota bacterium]|jgi:hypothetical protein